VGTGGPGRAPARQVSEGADPRVREPGQRHRIDRDQPEVDGIRQSASGQHVLPALLPPLPQFPLESAQLPGEPFGAGRPLVVMEMAEPAARAAVMDQR